MDVKIQNINKLIEYFGDTKIGFSERVGVNQSNLSSMLLGNRAIGDAIINKIVLATSVNKDWLLTGEGEMFKGGKEESNTPIESLIDRIPLLPLSAQGGSLNDFVMSVRNIDCEKIISPIQGASFAITVSGDSMAPEYPSGSTVLVKKINESRFIEWGRVYVLDTCNGVVIKRLVPSKEEECVRCISDNNDPIFSPFDISKKDIFGIYRVLLCMSVK